MCGRFSLSTPPKRLARLFDAELADGVDPDGAPHWNVAPTDDVLALRVLRHDGEDRRILDRFRWGLVPSWAKDLAEGARQFNARAESVADRPAFRSAFAARRAAVLADGFYEWRKARGASQPFYFWRADGEPIAFAGLWERWRDPRRADDPGGWVLTCTLITAPAGADVEDVHDRMPVILERPMLGTWLDPATTDRHELEAMLRPSPEGTLSRHRVDRRVGNVANDGPDLIEPIGDGDGDGGDAAQPTLFDAGDARTR
jgi:putative SOS response-associated peptidase YedK